MEQKYQIGTESGTLLWNIGRMLEDVTAFQVIQCKVAELSEINPFNGNVDYAMTTDISKPLIVVELSENKCKLIDGNHRLYKALRLKMESIPAYFLSKKEHIRYIENYDEQRYNNVICDFYEVKY